MSGVQCKHSVKKRQIHLIHCVLPVPGGASKARRHGSVPICGAGSRLHSAASTAHLSIALRRKASCIAFGLMRSVRNLPSHCCACSLFKTIQKEGCGGVDREVNPCCWPAAVHTYETGLKRMYRLYRITECLYNFGMCHSSPHDTHQASSRNTVALSKASTQKKRHFWLPEKCQLGKDHSTNIRPAAVGQ